MSKDPIGFNAGDSNLYQYVGNDPITLDTDYKKKRRENLDQRNRCI